MRINEETTGCQFISLATLFRVSLLRLPRSTTTCTRYIYIYEDPTCHQRERKERKRGDHVGSFRPTGGEALRGSFCHLVVSFYGSSPSSSRIQTERTAYTKRRLAIDNFPELVSISFYALPYVYHSVDLSFFGTSEDLRNYRPTLSPFLFYSGLFFILLARMNIFLIFFSFSFNEMNLHFVILNSRIYKYICLLKMKI